MVALTQELEIALPPARLDLLRAVCHEANKLNSSLYLVGGFVRDLLLGAPPQDFDLVVEGDAIPLARALARTSGGRVTGHERFGTAKWHIPHGISQHETPYAIGDKPFATGDKLYAISDLPPSLDFVSARAESYPYPGALPVVERGSIKPDLHRRDFTINTLALRLDQGHFGELLDFWGGERDLREGKVRVLHSLSFMDDPTRMLRAVRLEQRLGFQIEERTGQWMSQALPLLDRVSGERIRRELEAIFNEDSPGPILARLHDLNILAHIHPDLKWDDSLAEKFRVLPELVVDPTWHLASAPSRAILYFAAWLAGLQEPGMEAVLERLRFTGKDADILRAARRLTLDADLARDLRPSEQVRALKAYPEAALAVRAMLGPPEVARRIQGYLSHLRFVSPAAGGTELMKRGLKPGPIYGKLLGALRDAWLDGVITSAEAESTLLDRLIAQEGSLQTADDRRQSADGSQQTEDSRLTTDD